MHKGPLTALHADKSAIVQMSSTFVALQVGSLAESGTTRLALERPLAGVYPLVVEDLRSAGERLAASSANERLVARVHNCMHFQVAGTGESFSTGLAQVVLIGATSFILSRGHLIGRLPSLPCAFSRAELNALVS
jgi:hypothetical protein